MQAKHLLDLCRTGQLYAIEAWIADGKSFRHSPSVKTTPLQAAMATGFHSLAEILANSTKAQEELDDLLAYAASVRQLDLVKLLIHFGGDEIKGALR